MITDRETIKKYAEKYNLPETDVLLIALNCSGLADTSNITIKNNRVRFKLKINGADDLFFMAVCLNTTPTSFSIEDERLLLDNRPIGTVINQEDDTCTESYFRRHQTSLTLNSNSRSQCIGCKFCGTYNLSSDDKQPLTDESYLLAYLKAIRDRAKLTDFSTLEEVAVCTGCFQSENDLVEHLLMLKKILSEFNFTNEIKYIGSQLVSRDKIKLLKDKLGRFSLYFTVECFTHRDELLRPEKKLDLNLIKSILTSAKNIGVATSIVYILGLEDLKAVAEGMDLFKNSLTRYPVINVMQNYLTDQENLKITEAKKLDYYLKARRIIEEIYQDSGFKPQLWEGYRSLWYTTHNDLPLTGAKI